MVEVLGFRQTVDSDGFCMTGEKPLIVASDCCILTMVAGRRAGGANEKGPDKPGLRETRSLAPVSGSGR
jgi:hypothetical protein